MPPVLDPTKSKIDGLAFLGLSLARKSNAGHEQSATHQTSFDLNQVLDRDYQHLFSTNDDGWLVGGGEPGPPRSYKLAAADSAHVELMRIGTYEPDWGGVARAEILAALSEAKILIPEITVVPTAVVANGDKPPELEIRFDMESAYHDPEPNATDYPALPVNWQLRFLHNQLFRHFHFASRFCPGGFHSTIVRKAEFRSEASRNAYFQKCLKAVAQWRQIGPKPLLPPVTKNVTRVSCPPKQVAAGVIGSSEECKSGLWLFTDRNHPTHLFEPNFLPPYDTPKKRKIIYEVLSEEWNERTLSWQPAPPLPKPQLLKPDGSPKSAVDPMWASCTDNLCGP